MDEIVAIVFQWWNITNKFILAHPYNIGWFGLVWLVFWNFSLNHYHISMHQFMCTITMYKLVHIQNWMPITLIASSKMIKMKLMMLNTHNNRTTSVLWQLQWLMIQLTAGLMYESIAQIKLNESVCTVVASKLWGRCQFKMQTNSTRNVKMTNSVNTIWLTAVPSKMNTNEASAFR